jgi:hypothetical protein
VFPGRNPARRLAGGEGNRVGEHEEVERNLLLCSVGAGVAGGGLAVAALLASGRRWRAVVVRRGWAYGARPERFRGSRGTDSRASSSGGGMEGRVRR